MAEQDDWRNSELRLQDMVVCAAWAIQRMALEGKVSRSPLDVDDHLYVSARGPGFSAKELAEASAVAEAEWNDYFPTRNRVWGQDWNEALACAYCRGRFYRALQIVEDERDLWIRCELLGEQGGQPTRGSGVHLKVRIERLGDGQSKAKGTAPYYLQSEHSELEEGP